MILKHGHMGRQKLCMLCIQINLRIQSPPPKQKIIETLEMSCTVNLRATVTVMQLSITCPLHTPITGWGGEIGGGIHSLTRSLCPAIGNFELSLVTSKLQKVPIPSFRSDREIILRDIPRGGVFGFSYFPIPYNPPPIPVMGGVGHNN